MRMCICIYVMMKYTQDWRLVGGNELCGGYVPIGLVKEG